MRALKRFCDSHLYKRDFNSFVTVKSNLRAVKVAGSFTRDLARRPSLLIIHGRVGNGKSHLTGAICGEITRIPRDIRISIGNSESLFGHDLACDLLVIDSADPLVFRFERGRTDAPNSFSAVVESCHRMGISLVLNMVDNPMDLPTTLTLLKRNFQNIKVAKIYEFDLDERIHLAEIFWKKTFTEEFPESMRDEIRDSLHTVRAIEGHITRLMMLQELARSSSVPLPTEGARLPKISRAQAGGAAY